MVDPLSGLHGGPLKTGEPRRSRASLLQLTGWRWGFIWARTRLLNGYRRTADRVIAFRGSYRTHNSTYKLLLTSQTHKERGFLRNEKKNIKHVCGKQEKKNILNIKNTTKAQRDAELTKRTQREIKRGKTRWKVGRLEAVSLTNTRGSSNSSNTQVYYKLYVCILDVLYKALKYRIIF